MEKLLTNKTVSLTELRDPAKVLEKAGDTPVAILNRNKVVGYIVPDSAVNVVAFKRVDSEKLKQVLADNKVKHQPVLDYLKDK